MPCDQGSWPMGHGSWSGVWGPGHRGGLRYLRKALLGSGDDQCIYALMSLGLTRKSSVT